MARYTRLSVLMAIGSAATLCLTSIPAVAQCPPAVGYALSYDTGTPQPYGVAVGDFNADGKLDIAIANYGDAGDPGRLTILLGNGDNTFQAPVYYAEGLHPTFIVAALVNGDPHVDLVASSEGSNNIAVLIGNGDGTFISPAATYAVGLKPSCVAIGLLNADTFPDAVVCNSDDPANGISVLLGDGVGGFGAATSFGGGLHPRIVTLADVSGDGKLDVIVATGAAGTALKRLDNDGNGVLGAPQDIGAPGTLGFVTAGNIDADNLPDLLATDTATNKVVVTFGSGSSVNLDAGSHPVFIAVGHVNGDTLADVIVSNEGTFGNPADPGGLSVFIGHGNGTFDPVNPYSAPTPPIANPHALVLADFGADGQADVLAASHAGARVTLLRGQGDGQFPVERSYVAGNDPAGVGVADFDGDGDLDLAVANATGSDISILHGDSNGGFSTAQTVALSSDAYGLTVGDVTGDGKPDVVAALALTTDPDPDLAVLKNDGTGHFQAPVYVRIPGYTLRAVAIADLLGDGNPDLLVPSQTHNKVFICRGLGGGAFQDPIEAEGLAVGAEPVDVAAVDENGDGKLDIIALNNGTQNCSVLLGNGNGTFQVAKHSGLGAEPYRFLVTKLNGDNFYDLVVTTAVANPAILTLMGKADGTFQPPAVFSNVDNGVRALGMADVDGDDIKDLVAFGAQEGFVLPAVGNGTFLPPVVVAVCTGLCNGFFDLAIGDFDGDGRADIALARDGTPGTVVITPNIGGQVSITGQPAPASICVGQGATFTVQVSGLAARTYQWRKDGAILVDVPGHIAGATTPTLTVSAAILGDTGAYDVVVTACNHDLAPSNAASLTVSGATPSISGQPQNHGSCAGQATTFTVTADGSPSYQWRKDGVNLTDNGHFAGTASATLTINAAALGDAGGYDCILTNGCGPTTSSAATLTIHAGPTVTAQPQSQTGCVGRSVTFTVGAAGSPTYQWRKNGVHINGATSNSYSIAAVAASDAGSYDCIVTSPEGCSVTTSQAQLDANAGPTITGQPQASNRTAGESASFTVTANATPAPSYQWRRNGAALNDGGAISGTHSATLTINPTAVGDGGSYDCVVTNTCGSATTATVALIVSAIPSGGGDTGGGDAGGGDTSGGDTSGGDTSGSTGNGTGDTTGTPDPNTPGTGDQAGQEAPATAEEEPARGACGGGACGVGVVPAIPVIFGLSVAMKLVGRKPR